MITEKFIPDITGGRLHAQFQSRNKKLKRNIFIINNIHLKILGRKECFGCQIQKAKMVKF